MAENIPLDYIFDLELLTNSDTRELINSMKDFSKFKLRPLSSTDIHNSKYSKQTS